MTTGGASLDKENGEGETPMKNSVKILVVDDEPGIRDLLAYELSARGFQVSTAADGVQALERVKDDKFNLIISDIKMPKMDGLETLEAVKRLDPDVEVIMATGYGTIETAVKAMKMGAYDFVQKPFNLGELLALIDKALEKSELKTMVAVYEASKAIFSSIKVEVLLPIILKLSQKILRADEVSIMLAEPDGALRVAAYVGNNERRPREARVALGDRVAGKVALSREPVVINGPLEKDPRFGGVSGRGEIKSSIVYPLVLEGELLGVLNANRIQQRDLFVQSDLQSVTIFCSQMAQAVYNAKLYKEVEEKVQRLNETCHKLEETQRQLVQTEKLAAIGQLAAGVAHELNNPLTGILGFAQLLLQEEGLNKRQKEDLDSIYKQSQRCRQIIQNLLRFSHRTAPKKEVIRLVPLLESTLQLVQYEFTTSGVEIRTEFSSDIPRVYGDPNELQQVFLNLLTNGRQALENRKGGRITIGAENQEGRAVLRFADNGCGISPENLEKIFDPFFTTKPVGKGTGLGLSISYGIIQQHQGAIRAESRVNEGTTFIIDLPAHQEGA